MQLVQPLVLHGSTSGHFAGRSSQGLCFRHMSETCLGAFSTAIIVPQAASGVEAGSPVMGTVWEGLNRSQHGRTTRAGEFKWVNSSFHQEPTPGSPTCSCSNSLNPFTRAVFWGPKRFLKVLPLNTIFWKLDSPSDLEGTIKLKPG